MASKTITIRIPDREAARLARLTDRKKDRFAPTVTQIMLLGLEKALTEMEKKNGRMG